MTGVQTCALPISSVRLLPQPDPRDYPDTDTYADAERKWARRQGAADERDEALTDGIVLTALGGLCFAVIPLAGGDVTTRLQHPGLVYTLPTAQEAVDRYNQAIRVRFGVASVTVEVP